MRRAYLLALIALVGLTLMGCSRKLGGNPEISQKVAANNGANLKLNWKPVENADGYKVYCDGQEIWKGGKNDTTYTIQGSSKVCKEVIVSAFRGKDENKTPLDLSPKSASVSGLDSYCSDKCAIRMDISSGNISPATPSEVDPNVPNTGWLIFTDDGSNPYLVDLSYFGETPKVKVSITDRYQTGYFAPGVEGYSQLYQTDRNGKHFFWADNTSRGSGIIDENDNFGMIVTTNLYGSGPFFGDFAIYIQMNVKGLRWVKYE